MHTRYEVTLALAVALFSALCDVSPAQASAVTRHDLRVTLDPERGVLTGEGVLTLAPAKGPVELILGADFTLESAALLVGDAVRAVTPGAPRPAKRPGTDAPARTWSLTLDRPARDGLRLSVRWSGKPPALTEDVRFSRDEVASMPSGYIAPEGAFLSSEAVWYPTGDQPTSDYQLTATVPAAWRVVSEGRLAGGEILPDGRRQEVYDGVHPLEGVDLVAAPWRVQEETHDGARVAVYTLPGTPEDLSGTYLKAVAGYLDRFSRQIGPHPWPQFVVAEHILPTGYGMPSFTLLGGQVMRLPFIVKTSLGHEVLHDWWGNGVYVDRTRGNWCEGLTTYLADHAFAGEQGPHGDVDYRRQILRDYAEYVGRGGAERPISDFRERQDRADRSLGYGKVAMVFHMLRREIGAERFEQGLRALFSGSQFQRASWSDLDRVFSRAAGRSLSWFFRQWVEKPGAPEMRLDQPAVTGRRVDGRTRLDVHVSAAPGWKLAAPVEVEVSVEGAGERTHVRGVAAVDGGRGVASLEVPGPVLSGVATLDPDVDVFRRLDPREIPATLARLLARPADLVVLGAARGAEIQKAAQKVAETLANGASLVRPDGDVSEADLSAAHLVWVVGLPAPGTAAARLLLARAPAGFSLAPERLQVHGQEASGADAAACIVLDSAEGRGAVGVLDALGPDAFAALGRRVGHYGKYSWLLFAGDRAVVKETAPAPSAPSAAFGALP